MLPSGIVCRNRQARGALARVRIGRLVGTWRFGIMSGSTTDGTAPRNLAEPKAVTLSAATRCAQRFDNLSRKLVDRRRPALRLHYPSGINQTKANTGNQHPKPRQPAAKPNADGLIQTVLSTTRNAVARFDHRDRKTQLSPPKTKRPGSTAGTRRVPGPSQPTQMRKRQACRFNTRNVVSPTGSRFLVNFRRSTIG